MGPRRVLSATSTILALLACSEYNTLAEESSAWLDQREIIAVLGPLRTEVMRYG